MSALRLLPILLSISLSATARVRAVQHPGSIPSPRSVLWIAAHPDDEAVAAPLLAAWCNDQHARCGMLIMTRGEAGACLKPEGCVPELATVRSAEAGAVSRYFSADLILLSVPDGGVASAPALVETVAAYINAFSPEVILTFDPRHGTTCHPDHRAIGAIAHEAAARVSPQPTVYFLETRMSVTADPLTLHFSSASPGAYAYDANTVLASTREPAWNAVIDDMQRHVSQFDASWIAAVQKVSPSERAVFIAPAESALSQSIAPCQ